MKTLIIGKNQLNENNEYIGSEDLSEFNGNIKIEANLGWVKFKCISASGNIVSAAGTGIEAVWGIKAGLGIEAGAGIEAGWSIKAGWGIKAGLGIEAGTGIKAGAGIKAGWSIEAGNSIEAGTGIKAGNSIEAGAGIKAGLSISCKKSLSSNLRIFAGICIWEIPTEEDLEITCGRLDAGEICHGNLIETGIDDISRVDSDAGLDFAVICGVKYQLTKID